MGGLNAAPPYVPIPPDVAPVYNPNVYMATTIGSASSVTIPVAKAFAVWEYWASAEGGKKLVPTPFTGSLSVNVVWEEALGGGNNDIVGTPTLSSTSIADQNATITVPTTGNVGNAVVSLSDGHGIRWSWHIWVTASPATINFNNITWMDRNLGATSATPAQDGALGLLYQWGRHTPMPGYTKFDGTGTTMPVVSIHQNDILAPDGNGVLNGLAYAIGNPLSSIGNASNSYDWYGATSSKWNDRWTGVQVQDIKCPAVTHHISSITNPYPKGWKIPMAYDSQYVSPWEGLDALNPSNYDADKGWNWPSAGYYPAAGYRYLESALLVNGGGGGYYWSASTSGSTYARYMSISDEHVLKNNHYARIFSFSVRCIKD